MYVVYSKNKPQSDALLSSHGNAFFKVIPSAHPPQLRGPQPGRS